MRKTVSLLILVSLLVVSIFPIVKAHDLSLEVAYINDSYELEGYMELFVRIRNTNPSQGYHYYFRALIDTVIDIAEEHGYIDADTVSYHRIILPSTTVGSGNHTLDVYLYVYVNGYHLRVDHKTDEFTLHSSRLKESVNQLEGDVSMLQQNVTEFRINMELFSDNMNAKVASLMSYIYILLTLSVISLIGAVTAVVIFMKKKME